MKLPYEVKRLLIMWANDENHSIRVESGWPNVACGFSDYRPDTSYRETDVNRVEWTAQDRQAIEKITLILRTIGLYDPLAYVVVRKYWLSGQSVNAVYECGLGIGKSKIKNKLDNSHKAITQGLGIAN